MTQYQLEEANRQLAASLRQFKETNNLLEIEKSNRTALIGLYGEWKTESEAEYAKLLESSTQVTNKLREEVSKLRSQLATEETRFNELQAELDNSEITLAELRSQLSGLRQKSKIDAASKNFPDFPEAADILNRLKSQRKKSRADLGDVEVVLEILGADGSEN